ncbi:1-acyl-sn-glycerol-3-phosphate acyltransferase [Burkholderia cepacia]|uniref:1-acyl-sn-glycerol-3-phosphate acyltransferase n=1 Tax=Burkholderia cepacia TaxID=292 RepID=UPI001CF26DC9|nr:1-acyl-sn-glycerol-3-phosphate acyltransferase [Burkholderia cepacia]MCA8355700.1 1-acyl-sn-glycerol-3-phosphate acyltransferase [Burkholderia cepacia]
MEQLMRRPLLVRGLATIALWVFRTRVAMSVDANAAIVNGRAIVCANHVSLLDGVLIAFASPAPLVFAVDPAYARNGRVARWGLKILSQLGFGDVVPLDPNTPYGLRTLRRALERGRGVMVFPEGCISPDGRPQAEQPGVTWLAARTGATIVRLSICGAETSRLFSKSGRQWWPQIRIESESMPRSRHGSSSEVLQSQGGTVWTRVVHVRTEPGESLYQ